MRVLSSWLASYTKVVNSLFSAKPMYSIFSFIEGFTKFLCSYAFGCLSSNEYKARRSKEKKEIKGEYNSLISYQLFRDLYSLFISFFSFDLLALYLYSLRLKAHSESQT